MYGFWYSVRQNYSFTRKEFTELILTSIAFAFIVSFRKWGAGKTVDVSAGFTNLLFALIFVFAAMFIHVSFQKIIAIKLGYKAKYTYWLNGVLICVFLAFISAGYIVFILPGAILIEHIPTLRLGKFRYGTNLKDLARISVAGPLSHIFTVMVLGIIYFAAGRNEIILSFMIINMFLAVYSMLPIPKIDVPTKMDSGADGLGLFFFSRTLYVLTFITILLFTGFVFIATSYATLWWLFIVAFIFGCIAAAGYSISIEQKN